MSGKGEGKKRNREAQSEQHGFQESPIERAVKPGAGEKAGTGTAGGGRERERVLEKMRELEEHRRQQEGEGD